MEPEKEAPRELDILDGLKDRAEEILTQFKEGTGDIKSAWEDIRTQLVAAYEFGSDKMEADDDDLSGVDTSELIDELSGRELSLIEADWLSGIVLRHKGAAPFIPENLMDEQKLEILGEMMEKFSLDELTSMAYSNPTYKILNQANQWEQ